MRAVTLRSSTSITVEDRVPRAPGAGEVRIRVVGAAVNPSDPFLWRLIGSGAFQPGLVPGFDAAGIIDAVGPNETRLSVGQRVMAVVDARRPEGGAQAGLVVVPSVSVAPIADNIDLIEASTLPMTGLTAIEGLRLLDLPAGATLGVTGGAGQLASFLIPLAKRAGLHIIADATTEDTELVRSFGADDVVPRGETFVDVVRALAPDGVDAIFDTANLTRAVLPAIREGGAIAVILGWDGHGAPDRRITVHAVDVGTAMADTASMELLAAQAATGNIRLRVLDTYPPDAAADAYNRMEGGGLRGRLVITF